MQLIPQALFISIVTMGFHVVANQLYFEFHGDPSLNYHQWHKWKRIIYKPLWYCPTCMASVHGTFWHFILGGSLTWWLPTLLIVALFNTLINKWVN
jgi:hypothetical protein